MKQVLITLRNKQSNGGLPSSQHEGKVIPVASTSKLSRGIPPEEEENIYKPKPTVFVSCRCQKQILTIKTSLNIQLCWRSVKCRKTSVQINSDIQSSCPYLQQIISSNHALIKQKSTDLNLENVNNNLSSSNFPAVPVSNL